MKAFSKRLDALDRETSLDALARAKALEAEGREIIHLEIGEPDRDTPEHIKQAGIAALNDGYTHYGPAAGLRVTREAIAAHITADRGVKTSPEQVVVTPGAKAIIFFSMLALVEPGDEVIYPDPGFPNYDATIRMLGAVPVPLRLKENSGFLFDIENLASLASSKTKLCVLNTPHNPTGSVLSKDILEGIARLAKEHDFFVLSDEIYSKIVYDKPFESFYAIPGVAERTILLDGYSKTYAMTGWRLGYGVMPPDLATHVSRVMSNSNSCTCSFTQIAGIEALQGPQDSVRDMVTEFGLRRDIIVDGLNKIPGFRCHKPDGAFYVFPNITATGKTSKELANLLLEKAGVAVLPGTTFGEAGEGYLRLSYANSQENIRRALDKIATELGA